MQQAGGQAGTRGGVAEKAAASLGMGGESIPTSSLGPFRGIGKHGGGFSGILAGNYLGPIPGFQNFKFLLDLL